MNVVRLAATLALASALTTSCARHDSRVSESQLPAVKPAPQYVLTNQLGRSVTSASFGGKVQIVAFLFPYCTSYCPLIASTLVRFERGLKATHLNDRVRIVAFNVDPGGSGPPQLRAFMKEYGWNPDDQRWQFLTGSPAAIHRVVYHGYMVYYQKESLAQEARAATRERKQGVYRPQPTVENKLADEAHVNYDVVHNDLLEVVGPQGRIRKIYDDAEKVSEQQLISVIRELLPAKTS
ncbi:MAG: SCO family protein [Vulcanimicrobiaceae bacterium]